MHYSLEHRWFYYKDLTEDEVLMFQQTDSLATDGGGKKAVFRRGCMLTNLSIGVPHVSFGNPDADRDAVPRSSIEVRAFVFFL